MFGENYVGKQMRGSRGEEMRLGTHGLERGYIIDGLKPVILYLAT